MDGNRVSSRQPVNQFLDQFYYPTCFHTLFYVRRLHILEKISIFNYNPLKFELESFFLQNIKSLPPWRRLHLHCEIPEHTYNPPRSSRRLLQTDSWTSHNDICKRKYWQTKISRGWVGKYLDVITPRISVNISSQSRVPGSNLSVVE